MKSAIAAECRLQYAPVAILFADEKPDGALQCVEGRWNCVISLLTAAAKGRTAVLDRATVGCAGGRVGMGFRAGYESGGPPGGIEYFLSTGRGEGYPEGEGYKQTPELARGFIDALPTVNIPSAYIVFKPLDQVDPERETPQSVVFYATPDQLTALTALANYDREGMDGALLLWASGCQSIGILPYREATQPHPRAVVGMLDVSARPYVPADTLTFTVPYGRFLEMEANLPGSFVAKGAWQKMRERIPIPPVA